MAAIGGLINAGLVARIAGHHQGSAFVECLNTLEIEFPGVGRNRAMLPGFTFVRCAEDRALRTTRPDDATTNIVNAAEVSVGMGLLDRPLSPRRMDEEYRKEKNQRSHGITYAQSRAALQIVQV